MLRIVAKIDTDVVARRSASDTLESTVTILTGRIRSTGVSAAAAVVCVRLSVHTAIVAFEQRFGASDHALARGATLPVLTDMITVTAVLRVGARVDAVAVTFQQVPTTGADTGLGILRRRIRGSVIVSITRGASQSKTHQHCETYWRGKAVHDLEL